MAFFRNKLKTATHAAASATVSAVSNTNNVVTNRVIPAVSSTIHNPGKKKVDYGGPYSIYSNMNPNRDYYTVPRGKLKFRFSNNNGECMIYYEWRPYNNNSTVDLFYMVDQKITIKQIPNSQCGNVKYKEHVIRYHTYSEIIDFCQKYQSNNNSVANSRKFVIQLAEFCTVSIDELDGQKTYGIKMASQYYAVHDTVKDTVKGSKDILSMKPISGTTKIVGSVAKNTAKVGLATVKSINNQNITKDAMNVVSYNNNNYNNNNNDDYKEWDNFNDDYKGNDNEQVNTALNEMNNNVQGGSIEGDNCPICYSNGKSHAIQCGHILCWDCVQKLDKCPFCKAPKKAVVKLYNIQDDVE